MYPVSIDENPYLRTGVLVGGATFHAWVASVRLAARYSATLGARDWLTLAASRREASRLAIRLPILTMSSRAAALSPPPENCPQALPSMSLAKTRKPYPDNQILASCVINRLADRIALVVMAGARKGEQLGLKVGKPDCFLGKDKYLPASNLAEATAMRGGLVAIWLDRDETEKLVFEFLDQSNRGTRLFDPRTACGPPLSGSHCRLQSWVIDAVPPDIDKKHPPVTLVCAHVVQTDQSFDGPPFMAVSQD